MAEEAAISSFVPSTSHVFLAQSGGFAFEFSNEDLIGTPFTWPHRHVLTIHEFRFLLRTCPTLISNYGNDQIRARSASGILQKLLQIWQLSWFCASCIARLAQQLPLSLLEVSTFAHCMMVVLVYAVWFDRPQSVPEPVVFKGSEALHAFAALQCWDLDPANINLEKVDILKAALVGIYQSRCTVREWCLFRQELIRTTIA